MSDINNILKERGKRYGEFKTHARITQDIKVAMKSQNTWYKMNASQREALEMIAHKIARIINGDPDYIDSWDDVAGFATLVANELRGEDV